jgi:hypothetical protein
VKEAVGAKRGFAVFVWIKWTQLIIRTYRVSRNISLSEAKFFLAVFLETVPDTSVC